ncbi:hypothetical protein EV651_1043 [Kribbella sp. VKM Ac-2571]|uniref:hypothetical protein n=1 Tax=Kribbella sp. VKM Ac-2571 TaxID=2512222 RepID=UPI00105D02F3|nr:hypothetical protein [Kribbella sp. VKM Ac-2571]TDO66438.1 hypothetical protein EV651_1043 [Kribbella sp. VKM Ac-2571]
MRFIAVLRSAEDYGFPPPVLAERLAGLHQEAARYGILLDTAALLPSTTATRVVVDGSEMAIREGPSGQIAPVGAYAVYDVAMREEVVHWTRRAMDLHRRSWPGWRGEAEIRQIVGPAA